VFLYKQSVPAFFSVKPAGLRRWVLISGGVEGVSGVGLWLGLRLLLGVGVGVNSPGPNLRVGLRLGLGPRLATGTWPTFDESVYLINTGCTQNIEIFLRKKQRDYLFLLDIYCTLNDLKKKPGSNTPAFT